MSRRTLATVAAAAAILVGACSPLDDSDADRAAPRSTSTTATESSTTPTTGPAVPPPGIAWESCDSAECATVALPRDHTDPDGPTIDVFVRRLPATGDRIGPLFVNFGGPGAGTGLIDRFGWPREIRERFDIVGMDPRGVGRSTPLDCGVSPVELYGVDPTIEDDIDAQTLLDVSQRFVDDCEADAGDLLPHLGTRSVARDMDLIRAGMGDEQLSYLGFSYGTSIGQVYADLFPERTRAMVLDGLVDTEPSGIDVAIEQARGFETALANWADACPSRSTCSFSDPLEAVDRMLADAEDGIASSGDARALGPGEAAVGLAYPLYTQTQWGRLDLALGDALDGDGAGMVALADAYAELVDFSIYFAVSCLDSTWPRSSTRFLDRAAAAADAAPRFGEAIVNDYVRCALWPVPPDPIGPIVAADAEPILVVSTTGDPATPYENGVTVAERLASGVLLTYEGEGHTIVFQGSGCVDSIVIAYLVDLAPPDDGTTC